MGGEEIARYADLRIAGWLSKTSLGECLRAEEQSAFMDTAARFDRKDLAFRAWRIEQPASGLVAIEVEQESGEGTHTGLFAAARKHFIFARRDKTIL